MRVSILIFSLLLCQLSLFAQQVDWSPIIKKEGGWFGIAYLAGMTNDEYSVVAKARNRNEIVTYNHNHKLISTDQLDFKIGDQTPRLNSIIETKSSKYAIMTIKDKEKKELQVYASPFNKGKLGKAVLIHEHDYKTRLLSIGAITYGAYSLGIEFQGLIHSPDKSKLVYLSYNPGKKKVKNALNIVVFDENMNTLWKKKTSFPYPVKDFSIEQMNLTDDGKVIIVGRHNIGNSVRGYIYDYRIIEINENEKNDTAFKLEDGKIPSDMGLLKSSAEEIKVGGIYTNANLNNRLDGVFIGTLDLTSGEINSQTYQFEDSFLEGLISNRKIRNGKGLGAEYIIREFLSFEDGSYSFVAENTYTSIDLDNSGGGIRNQTIFHTDEIIIPHFSSSGELLNIDKIEKDFSNVHSAYGSYILAKNNGKVYLVFNDLKKRAERKDLGKKNSLFTDLAVINEKGELESQKTLFTSRDEDLKTFFSPLSSKSIDNKMILFGISVSDYQFGFLEFD